MPYFPLSCMLLFHQLVHQDANFQSLQEKYSFVKPKKSLCSLSSPIQISLPQNPGKNISSITTLEGFTVCFDCAADFLCLFEIYFTTPHDNYITCSRFLCNLREFSIIRSQETRLVLDTILQFSDTII